MDLRPVVVAPSRSRLCCWCVYCCGVVFRWTAVRQRLFEQTLPDERFVTPYYARSHQSIGLALRNCSLLTLTVFW